MMAWVHATVGAALGSRIRDKRMAFLAGIASHLICDLFPHRDYELEIELPLVTAAMTAIAQRHGLRSPELIGALGAISPDFENGLQRLDIVPETLFPTHTERPWFIGHGRAIKDPLPQIILAAVCVAIAEADRRRVR